MIAKFKKSFRDIINIELNKRKSKYYTHCWFFSKLLSSVCVVNIIFLFLERIF